MTQVQQILNYLWSIAPNGATNAQIAQGTGIPSHQGVYMTTQHLLYEERVRSERHGRTWVFYAVSCGVKKFGTVRQHRPYSCSKPPRRSRRTT